MALSQSDFLQSLGWSTLNSFWQMGLLWSLYLLYNYFFKPSSNRKYILAVSLVFSGTAWFLYTFISFYSPNSPTLAYLRFENTATTGLLPQVLTAASITYLALLIIPAYRVFRNWRFLQTVKKNSSAKAPLKNRLFVQKVSALLGIKKTVRVFISDIVTSPVTIGYIKPIILLPLAALTQLSPQQMEAILIHELTHIRRHDYLVNLMLTAVNVILYFNPFIRQFLSAIEAERENCCDELVLQFEYDKISYASALLQLQKNNHFTTELAMSATNKNHLLTRVEKIVGVKKKSKVNTNHFFGAFAALIILFTINSLIISGKETLPATSDAIGFSQPVSYLPATGKVTLEAPRTPLKTTYAFDKVNSGYIIVTQERQPFYEPEFTEPVVNNDFKNVAFDETDASLSDEQRATVKSTISSTKKVLKSKWSEVEKTIADGMNNQEKMMARKEYLAEIEKIDWNRMEKNMKADYEKMDWSKIQYQLATEIAAAKLDSVQQNLELVVKQLDHLKAIKGKTEVQALPDATVTEVKKARELVELKIKEISSMKERKIIKL
jgi:beta-lactamase regulating signal transducer with metallopeptidase domain